jgi:hypothetical protein
VASEIILTFVKKTPGPRDLRVFHERFDPQARKHCSRHRLREPLFFAFQKIDPLPWPHGYFG